MCTVVVTVISFMFYIEYTLYKMARPPTDHSTVQYRSCTPLCVCTNTKWCTAPVLYCAVVCGGLAILLLGTR